MPESTVARRTLSNPQHVAWRLLLTTHAIVTRRVDVALKASHCIPFEWYDVLMALNDEPDHRLRMGELADATLLSHSGLSRRVKRLTAAGLIRREPNEKDGRSFYAVLTKRGRQALLDAWPIYREVIESDFTQHLTEINASQVNRTLDKVLQAVGSPRQRRLYQDQITDEPRTLKPEKRENLLPKRPL
ncbi:MAG: helix-turn-helix domain-containing protein [Verrucomicrobiota bacterium]